MMTFTKLGLIIISLLLLSCSESKIQTYKRGICIKEINKRYVASANEHEGIYKVEEINESRLKVSAYFLNSWQYLGEKEMSYFQDKKLFGYQSIDCPDGSGPEKGIADKVKDITL